MTITVTARGNSPNAASNTQTNVSASHTPSANSRYIVVAYAQDVFTPWNVTISTTITGWTTALALKDQATDLGVSFDPHISVFEGVMGGSPSAGTVTVDWGTGTNPAYGSFQSFDLTGSVTLPTFKQAMPKPFLEVEGGGNTESIATPSLGVAATNGNTCIIAFGASVDAAGAAATPSGWTAVGTPQSANYATTGIWKKTDFTGTSVTCTDLGEVCGGAGSVIMEFEEPAALEQEGFRFRNDDGSETTATWAAAQDTDVTAPLATNLRLRSLVDATGDPASTAYTLYHKLSTDSVYVPVPTSSVIVTAFDALGAAPVTNATSTIDVAYPAGIVEGDLIVCAIASRLGSTAIDAEGFSSLSNNTANVATSEGTAGTEAADAGGVRITLFHKIADGTETGNVTFANSGTATLSKTGRMLTFSKNSWATWDLVAVNGKDTAGGTSYSAAMGADPGIAIGDILLAATAVNTDAAAWSAEDVTGTGLASALTTEQFEIVSTGGNDVELLVTTHDVTAALTSGVPTYVATASTGTPEGATVLLRIRATGAPPIVVSPSANITAGGVATTAQLTAPSGKTTGDFTTGRMWDDENGVDSIDIALDFYTELEWSLQAQSPAVNGDIYQFRVYAGTTALGTYTVTPEWTIGSGGSALTFTQTDPVGITDSASFAAARVLSSTDPVGITDTLSTAVSRQSTFTDAVGITDSATFALNIALSVTDNVGITDSTTLAFNRALDATDPIGITDSLTTVFTRTFTQTDPVGITDSASFEAARVFSPTDPVGITDSFTTAVDRQVSFTDLVGITDSASFVISVALSFTDPIGITDSFSTIFSRVLDATDPVGITDSASFDATKVFSATDPVGITDSVTFSISVTLDVTDPVGITDSFTPVVSRALDVTDPVGITDSLTFVADLQLTFTDSIGITDSLTTVTGTQFAPTDNVNITDSLTFVIERQLTSTDLVGITDSFLATLDAATTFTDPVGITDSATFGVSVVASFTDLIGITDSAAFVLSKTFSAADPVGVTDSLTFTQVVGITAIITCDPTGPALARRVTGPELDPVTVDGPGLVVQSVDGPAVSRVVTGPEVDPVGVAGPDVVAHSVDGPELNPRVVTGPAVAVIAGPVATIVHDVTGPALRRVVTGPELDAITVEGPELVVQTVTGPEVRRLVDGPALDEILVDGPGLRAFSLTGPEVQPRVSTGPEAEAKVLVGPSNQCA